MINVIREVLQISGAKPNVVLEGGDVLLGTQLNAINTAYEGLYKSKLIKLANEYPQILLSNKTELEIQNWFATF